MPELTTAQRTIARTIVQRHFPGRRVQVFGSRAYGNVKPWSDLDLAILGDSAPDDLAMAEARADFEESDLPFCVDLLPFCVDLVPWQDLPADLQQEIFKRGIPL